MRTSQNARVSAVQRPDVMVLINRRNRFLYGLEIEFADPLQKHEDSGLLTGVGDPVRPPRLNLKYVALSQQHFLIRPLHCNADVAFKNEEAIAHVGVEMPRHFLSRPNPKFRDSKIRTLNVATQHFV